MGLGLPVVMDFVNVAIPKFAAGHGWRTILQQPAGSCGEDRVGSGKNRRVEGQPVQGGSRTRSVRFGSVVPACSDVGGYLRRRRRAKPANAAIPVPTSAIVAGSGTGSE